MERKVLSLTEAKLFDGSGNDNDPGSFSGYGSVFGNYDRVNEAVVPGAFKNIDEWLDKGFIANNHDWSTTVAYPTSGIQDDYGLKFEAVYHSTSAAQDVRTIINERKAAKKYVGLSIGYTVNDAEDTPNGRLLKDLTLYEVSFVTVPANPLAGVTDSKGLPLTGESFEDHRSRVLAELKGLHLRTREVKELRAKTGRELSGDCQADLKALHDEVAALIALAEPKADPKAARALAARILSGA